MKTIVSTTSRPKSNLVAHDMTVEELYKSIVEEVKTIYQKDAI